MAIRPRAKPRYHVAMPESPNRVVIDRVDWKSVLPVLRLASALKYALQPGKLLVALIAVLAIHFSGLLLGELFHATESHVTTGSEIEAGMMATRAHSDASPYEAAVGMQAQAFVDFKQAALALDHGFGPGERGVADALGAMFMHIPAAIFDQHPWFTLLFAVDVLFVLFMAGGVICRMAATQVCRQQATSLRDAVGFVSRRWAWYLLSPLMPLLLMLLVGALLILAGLILFNAPWLDAVGALVYGLLLLGGFVIAIMLVLLLLSLFLMPPALSVEGTDGFDTIARSFNYILFRPWQYAGYLFGSAVYLAVVSVLVTMLAGLTVSATYSFVDIGSISDLPAAPPTVDGAMAFSETRHDMMLAGVDAAAQSESSSSLVSAWIVTRWFELVAAFVTAILFSTLCCLQTQVYVLMRRSADGTPMDQCDFEEPDNLWQDSAPAAATTEASASDDEPKAEG